MEKYSFIKESDEVIVASKESLISLHKGNTKIIFEENASNATINILNDEKVVSCEIHLNNEEKSCIKYDIEEGASADLNFYYYGNIKEATAHINIQDGAYININSVYLLKGQNTLTMNITLGKNSHLVLNGAAINSSTKEQCININVYHNDINSETNMLFYGICKNDSVLKINTDGIIKKSAINSVIHQTTKGLIISEKSMISANPLLHIDDNDVIASHGASIGTIDDEELYYLMSRGLTKDESRQLIIKGFLQPISRNLEDNILKDKITEELNKE